MRTPLTRRATQRSLPGILSWFRSPMRRRDGAPKAQDSEEPRPEEEAGDGLSTYEVHDSECDNNVGPRYKAFACTSSTAHQNISIALTSSRSFSRLMLTPTSRTKSLSDPLEVRDSGQECGRQGHCTGWPGMREAVAQGFLLLGSMITAEKGQQFRIGVECCRPMVAVKRE